jgi:hypothetical protein
MIGVDEKSVDDVVAALASRDNSRIESLVQSGKVFTVDANTRVRILNIAGDKFRVRVLEGPSIMIDGYVPERWIK